MLQVAKLMLITEAAGITAPFSHTHPRGHATLPMHAIAHRCENSVFVIASLKREMGSETG